MTLITLLLLFEPIRVLRQGLPSARHIEKNITLLPG
jgi:hypothetical protein